MKNVLASFLILTSAATSFATHVYRSQECTTTTQDYRLVYNGNYSFGGSYTATKVATGGTVDLFAKNDSGEQPDSNVFEVVRESLYSDKTTKADCSEDGLGFDQQETKARIAIKFSKLSEQDEQKLGMTSLQTRIFNCTTVVSSPVNCFGGKDIRD